MIGASITFGGTGDGLPEGTKDFLVNRDVVILADNDVGGRSNAARKAALAHPVARPRLFRKKNIWMAS